MRSLYPRAVATYAPALTLTLVALGLGALTGCSKKDADSRIRNVASTPAPGAAIANAADIVRDPTDLPPPLARREPKHVRVDLEAIEKTGVLAPGTTYKYWTFNGKVPAPFLRVRVGDQVEVHLKNPSTNDTMHSVDFHAVTGPGGGSSVMQVPPGEERSFTFRALHPGLFVYHCATPMVSMHIANGMFGMILVEPAEGLPPVDHEYYVMQSEIYTEQPYGTKGNVSFSVDKLLSETPEYYVFNGAVDSLVADHPLHAHEGQTIRIYFGDAGPDHISSLHLIGEHLERVWAEGSLETPPMKIVQTIEVPPGSATIADIHFEVPGSYTLVDHALSRLERGLVGKVIVDGPPQPDIFRSNGPTTHAN